MPDRSNMSHELLANLAALVALLGLMAYAVLGGADFGGGVWDLLATGPRRAAQRAAINRAMGPVWEANHVWLIFVLVTLFTSFPQGYSALSRALFVPFHLALAGIMLRGASFVFRGIRRREPDPASEGATHLSAWSLTFGIASLISPVLLGLAFGVLTEGHVRLDRAGAVRLTGPAPWASPYAVGCGLLALSTCAYLAAVFLTVETQGALREDFRWRAILAGTTTAALAALVLLSAWFEANWFFRELVSLRSLPVLASGLACFAASAWAVFGRRYVLSRVFAAGEIILLLAGWGIAQHPYLVYPDIRLTEVAAPPATIAFLLGSLPLGLVVLIPSLWLLFRTFKSAPPAR
jgi:cytochrome d ubiquinol oxidase subunit II